MPQIIVTVSEDQRAKLVTAICSNYGYSTEVSDPETGAMIPNPQTPGQFAQARLQDWGVGQVHAYESRIAHDAAEAQVRDAVAAVAAGVEVSTVEDQPAEG